MRNGLEQFAELREELSEYLKLRWTAMRLGAIDGASSALAKVFGYVIFLVLVFIALIFLMFALALWLGEVLGHPALGFLVAGGAFLVAAGMIYFVHDRLGRNAIVRYFVDMCFTDKDDDYEAQK
ncbi:MAG: phage holin family protein [Rikenellaceae bacterium]|jgi:hypothetical protein|nr:phage holin family protein [Rikenellaceae bacterium]